MVPDTSTRVIFCCVFSAVTVKNWRGGREDFFTWYLEDNLVRWTVIKLSAVLCFFQRVV